jgi:hypothetical protein
VLVPGQEDLEYRGCVERQKAYLLTWFANVEERAWRYVNAMFQDTRPDKIFLTVGQTLTNEYAIFHQEASASQCEVVLEPSVGIPPMFHINALLGYQFHRVTASIGFNTYHRTSPEDTRQYSVYFEVVESKPIKHTI